jgi:hypothetical protein
MADQAIPHRPPPMPAATLPLMLSTDLGSVQVLIRERDDFGQGLSDAAAPFAIQIDAFGGTPGQPYATIPLTLEHVQAIHTALGAFLASLIPGDPMHRKHP